jgi:cytochrome oxidase Cu insertion factor (SCO1/SenC/PrrC family)
MHRLAQTFEEAVSLDVHGHTITVHPEDDPVTLCEEYLSQWEW